MLFEKDNPLRIIYVGRLEREKGVDILIDMMCRMHEKYAGKEPIFWDICGTGSFAEEIQKLHYPNVQLHGYIDGVALSSLRSACHTAMMPSRFLETFGLVALESIISGLAVIGFRKGGLIPFISPSYALDEARPVGSFETILEKILQDGIQKTIDISSYSLEIWRNNLSAILGKAQKILLVSDYIVPIGGTEKYIFFLRDELIKMGKEVELFGYSGSVPKWKGLWFLFVNPFSFWRFFSLRRKVGNFQPDVIWGHSLLRYIGLWGILAIDHSRTRSIITHHDLGLITLYPSATWSESEIPENLSLGRFLRGQSGIIAICGTILKWSYIRVLWTFITRFSLHLVPSEFLIPYYKKNTPQEVRVFPHTYF